MNEVFHIQNCPQMNTDFRAVFVGNTLRLINENPNNRLVRGTCNLRVHQLEAVVDCHPFSDFLNPSRNRSVCHSLPLKGSAAQKKKWARTHRTRPCAFDQARNYTETAEPKQPDPLRSVLALGVRGLVTALFCRGLLNR